MHILWALVIGLVIGAIAKFIVPGKDSGWDHCHQYDRYGRVTSCHFSGAGSWLV